MKAFLTNILKIAVSAAFLTGFCACESRHFEMPKGWEEEDGDDSGAAAVTYQSYMYGDKEYPIASAYYYRDADYISFVLSPVETGKERTTYMDFGLYASFEGQTVDVTKYYHNDDYYFIYEDPLHFYPRYSPLREGTIYVKQNAGDADSFVIEIDVVLADGTPVYMDYDGPLRKIVPETSGIR